MNESITRTTTHFSPTASLAAIGVKVNQLDLFGPIRTMVQIRQKTVKHTPADKLYDAWISMLAGAHGLPSFLHEGFHHLLRLSSLLRVLLLSDDSPTDQERS